MNFILELVGLGAVAFVQNMAFTWVSRSRNGGDVVYHRFASWASNGIWFVTQLLLWNVLWGHLTTGSPIKLAIVGAVYVLSTTEGSCLMTDALNEINRLECAWTRAVTMGKLNEQS